MSNYGIISKIDGLRDILRGVFADDKEDKEQRNEK